MKNLLNKILFVAIFFIAIISLFWINKSWLTSIFDNNNFIKYTIFNILLLFIMDLLLGNIKYLFYKKMAIVKFSDFLFLCDHHQVKKVIIYNNFLRFFLIRQEEPKNIIKDIINKKQLSAIKKSDSFVENIHPLKIKNHYYIVYFPKNYFNFIDRIIDKTNIDFVSMGIGGLFSDYSSILWLLLVFFR